MAGSGPMRSSTSALRSWRLWPGHTVALRQKKSGPAPFGTDPLQNSPRRDPGYSAASACSPASVSACGAFGSLAFGT